MLPFWLLVCLRALSLSAGSSVRHALLCFSALIGCFRKEGCVSRILPASCCVLQQSRAPLPPSPWNKEVCFYWTFLFCRGITLVKYPSRESPTSIYCHCDSYSRYANLFTFIREICTEIVAALKALCSCWVVCTGMYLDYRGDTQCKAIISTALTTMYCTVAPKRG